MTSESLPVAAAIKTFNVPSDSDDSDDESPVPICQVRRRMPMCLKASEIDGKTSAENRIYSSKFLNYRKKRLQYIETPTEELLDDKINCDIEEEEESIFLKNSEPFSHGAFTRRNKILAIEKHVDDIINSVAQVPEATIQLDPCSEVPLVTQISDGTASILKEFEDATSILCDPKMSSLSDSNTSVDSDSDDCYEMSREVSVKVRWRSSIKRYQMKSSDPFSTLISKVAKEIGANTSDILLALNDMTIKHSDTPDKIKLSVVDIIDCYVIKMIAAEIEDDSVIELKLQSENRWKKVVKIHKDSPMETLIEQCASEKGIAVGKVIFKFDGEVIDPSESPADLDLESGLCIDVTFLT